MRVKQLLVLPNLPERIKCLQEMSQNLWYSWNWDVVRLFIRLDADLWESSSQNPVEMLARLPQETLQKAAQDEAFLVGMDRIYEKYRDYMSRKKWFHYKYRGYESSTIAYFSLEYGLDTGLPVYSGGLGVLSGDTLKSASDLGLPMVAVGLLYRYGYFRQFLSADGWQQERYEENDWYHMPVEPVRTAHDEPLRVVIELDGVPVMMQVWKVKVGLVPLYLLDTNIPENSSRSREITSVLYGGDKDMRIRQEIVLGIGGMKALRALGLEPAIYHSNEGHSWFLTLERLRLLVTEKGLNFNEALQYVWSTTVFTTHTPVPAGNERFDPVLVHRYLGDMVKQLGIGWKDFLALGRVMPSDEAESFGMTVAALKCSAFCNGVSQLHGKVSRQMWHNIWPELPTHEIPINAITNGVHPASWISHDMNELYASYFGPRYSERPGAPEVWERIEKIPDVELWRVHNRRRERLVFFARKRLKQQLERRGVSALDIQRAEQVLDPNALTIGFARRFSTYKRGYLIFSDPDRLHAILSNEKRPVQLIISGKAHPLDTPGKEIIKRIIAIAGEERFRNRIIFLEDYDINVARYLVQGTDVWLNNPRRPEEASGTSGMKAALNGALNLSVLDGWWAEAYNEEVGFRIGNGEEYTNVDVQDRIEAESLFKILEREVVPLFYNRDARELPAEWLVKMKATIRMAGQRFSAQHMLMGYADQFYIPALGQAQKLSDNNHALTREVTAWLEQLHHNWEKVGVREVELPEMEATVFVGQHIPVKVKVSLGDLQPTDVSVEIIAGRMGSQDLLQPNRPVVATLNGAQRADGEHGLWAYHGEIICEESGRLGISARVVPRSDKLPHLRRPKLISWW